MDKKKTEIYFHEEEGEGVISAPYFHVENSSTLVEDRKESKKYQAQRLVQEIMDLLILLEELGINIEYSDHKEKGPNDVLHTSRRYWLKKGDGQIIYQGEISEE